MFYQQGDVLLRTVDDIPADAVKLDPKEHQNTLARGEATGHVHRVLGDADWFVSKDTQGWGCGTGVYLKTGPKRIEVAHLLGRSKADHDSIFVPDHTKIQVGRVREYDHFAEEARRVQD